MPHVLITYDIDRNHVEMKANLVRRGYADSWDAGQVTQNLPNTTLWHSNTTANQGRDDMQNAAREVNATLERAVAVEFGNVSGIPGRPHR